MRRIVEPGTPRWQRVLGPLAESGPVRRVQRWLAAATIALMGAGTAVAALGALGSGETNETIVMAGAALIFGTPVALGAAAGAAMRRTVAVSHVAPALRGVPITGQALELLDDIDARFAYA